MKINLIADTDAYKPGHTKLMHPGLTFSHLYGEARIGSEYETTVFFGMQILLEKYFKNCPTQADLDEAIEISIETNGYNTVPTEVWEKVIALGHIPMEIKAAPEGSIIPAGNVLFTMTSTEEWFAKTIGNFEPLLMHIWYPIAVASRIYGIKNSITPYYKNTGSMKNLTYALNDFGLRGATCIESARIAGMAHFLFFEGSDNQAAARALKHYYSAPIRSKSIMATEHSVALSFGKDNEKGYLLNALRSVPNEHGVSVVIDTWDPHGFTRNVAGDPEVLEFIKAKEGRVVFRPDSGVPEIIVPQILSLLEEILGSTLNDQGFKVLKHNVGVIQADGMDEHSIPVLYETITRLGFSADNIVIGSGGGLHQVALSRDTIRFAIKMSYGIIDGQEMNFKKNPMTDTTKGSKPGMLKLHPYKDTFSTISSANESKAMFASYIDSMRVVYRNGERHNVEVFKKIYERANKL